MNVQWYAKPIGTFANQTLAKRFNSEEKRLMTLSTHMGEVEVMQASPVELKEALQAALDTPFQMTCFRQINGGHLVEVDLNEARRQVAAAE